MKKNLQPSQEAYTLDIKFQLEYLLFSPKSYGQSAAKKWPLIVFLHGARERGNDLDQLKKHGILKIVENNPDFPFITVSSQCPNDCWWSGELRLLNGLADEITKRCQVDTSKIYLTGLSMGGFGIWSLASITPERLAAIAPICGGGGSRQAARALKICQSGYFTGQKIGSSS